MKKYARPDQRRMALWAADCAARVLPLFEKAFPNEDRPRQALATGRTWARTGVFRMATIRGASLGAHAAARAAREIPAAGFAARAAGQAVATAHVPQHAFGAAYYALKAIAAATSPARANAAVARERTWQVGQAPAGLRSEVRKRIVVEERPRGLFIGVRKDEDY